MSNSNNIVRKSTFNKNKDYRLFMGGNYSRDFSAPNFRPMIADIYNEKMGSCDNFDVYIHRFSLRFLPLRNRLAWILKPLFNNVEFQFLNSFFLYREAHPSPDLEFRLYLLKISQGLVKNSPKPGMTPLRVRGNELFPRNFCNDCKNQKIPNKDCRTSKKCSKCGSGCCRNHSKTVCDRCFS